MAAYVMNPNHEDAERLTDMWPQIALILMLKQGLKTVCITAEDCQKLADDACVTVLENHEGMHLTIVTKAEGLEMAKGIGGLPN